MSHRLLWVLSAVVASAASAQPAYSVSPDTLDYIGNEDSAVEIANLDADTLTVSFPVFSTEVYETLYGTTSGITWYFSAGSSGVPGFSLPFPYLVGGETPPTFRVAPDDTLRFELWGYDLCPLCRRTEAQRDTVYDVLHLRVADGTRADTARVPFEPVYVVPNEPGPEPQPLAVRLAPNPAAGTTVVSVEAERLVTADVTVFDALGRAVRQHEQPTGTAVLLDLRTLPPGVYVVRARVAGRGIAAERLVVIH